jgi:predicted transposase YdaD
MSSKPFDATLKDLLEMAAGAWPRLLGPWPFQRVELVDADVSTVTAAADKVLLVHGDHDWLLHLELQSSYEADLAERLHLYGVLLRHRHRLPVRSVVLLLRREANAAALTGELRLQFPDEAAPYDSFRYRVVRLWELSAASLLAGDLGIMPLAPLTDEATPSLPAVIRRLDERAHAEAPAEVANKLLAAAYVLMGLRYTPELIQQVFQGITTMEESTTYQYIISQGAIREVRRLLLRLGRRRFGPPDTQTVAAIEAIADLDSLERLTERLLDTSSWQELLTPAV